MEIFVSAILGELTTRSINFFISKIFKPLPEDVEDRLKRVLLRAQIIVNEATGRHITNQAILLQLDMLRDAIHRGHYTLDTFRYQSHAEETKDQILTHSWSLSKENSTKGYIFGRSAQMTEQLREELDRLSSMIIDVDQLLVFFSSCPRLYRQPYSMHILLSNCMFGRQMEVEFVFKFLLHAQPYGAEELEVLPIVGPGRVGKSTLVYHVCNDERIRDHFSEIVFLRDYDFRDAWLSVLEEKCAMEHQNCASKKDRRLLLVVEVAGDVNENAWKKLCSVSQRCATNGTKIIITSRSDKITRFGTTGVISLKYLSNEALWYFFKTLTFGSTDLEEHPRLAHLAMELAKTQKGNLIAANIDACLLKDNFDIHFWCKVLAFKRQLIQKHHSEFGEHPSDLLNRTRPAHIGRMGSAAEDFIVCDQYQRSSQEEVPDITLQDVVYGNVKPHHGKFEVLTWRSRIPPYHSFVYTCEIQELKARSAKRKRSMKKGVTLC